MSAEARERFRRQAEEVERIWREDSGQLPSKDQPTRLRSARFSVSREPDLRKITTEPGRDPRRKEGED